MTRGACLIAVALAALAGCGGDEESAGTVLRATAERMGEVRSGDLDMRVLASSSDRPGRGVGFRLSGPFSLAGDRGGRLPVTRMRYTRELGVQRTTGVLTSTGREAYVTVGGATTKLDAETAKSLELGASGSGEKGLGKLGLDVDRWLVDAKLGDGPTIDGVKTDRVTGRLSAGRAVRDVLTALRRGGAPVPEVGDALADRLDDAVRTSTAEVLTGREDRILRRLRIEVDLKPAKELEAAVPGGGAVRLTAGLDLRRPNRSVRVERP